jgi:hypothetical protein
VHVVTEPAPFAPVELRCSCCQQPAEVAIVDGKLVVLRIHQDRFLAVRRPIRRSWVERMPVPAVSFRRALRLLVYAGVVGAVAGGVLGAILYFLGTHFLRDPLTPIGL